MFAYLVTAAPPTTGEKLYITLIDYVAFISLLGSLYIISGGIYLRGALVGTPGVSSVF